MADGEVFDDAAAGSHQPRQSADLRAKPPGMKVLELCRRRIQLYEVRARRRFCAKV